VFVKRGKLVLPFKRATHLVSVSSVVESTKA